MGILSEPAPRRCLSYRWHPAGVFEFLTRMQSRPRLIVAFRTAGIPQARQSLGGELPASCSKKRHLWTD
jgi:hypothetical protein